MSPTRLQQLTSDGLLRRLHREVLVDARVPDTVKLRAQALSLVLPEGAAIARQTAAWLYGVDARAPGQHLDLPEIVCVVPSDRASPLRRPGISCHEADLRADVVHVAGVPCTSPLRTTVDLLRYAPPFIGLAAADSFARKALVLPAEVVSEVERWRGHRYTDRARRLAAQIEPKSESAGESWLRLRILDAGFPRPEAQIWVPEEGPGAHRIDLGYRARRKGIEYDGEEFHAGPSERAHDEQRRTALERDHGWLVIGVGRGEVLGPSLALEYALGEFLGMEPQIRRRLW
jgi:hypothetical protein